MADRERKFMKEALKEAEKAFLKSEVPIGAVVVYNDRIIGRGHNQRINHGSAIDHAEMIAIRKANKKLGDWRLDDAEIYVTLEPCPMCAGAIQQARIKKVVFGASDLKSGSLKSLTNLYSVKGYNHYPEVESGVMEEECALILKEFFRQLREKKTKEE